MKVDKTAIGLLAAALVLGLCGSFLEDMGGYKSTASLLGAAAAGACFVAMWHFWMND